MTVSPGRPIRDATSLWVRLRALIAWLSLIPSSATFAM